MDALLDRSKRLGIWAPRKTLHMALLKYVERNGCDYMVSFARASIDSIDRLI